MSLDQRYLLKLKFESKINYFIDFVVLLLESNLSCCDKNQLLFPLFNLKVVKTVKYYQKNGNFHKK